MRSRNGSIFQYKGVLKAKEYVKQPLWIENCTPIEYAVMMHSAALHDKFSLFQRGWGI